MKKFCPLIVVIVFSGQAEADRLFNVPVARTLPSKTLRYESLQALNNRFTRFNFFAFSPATGYEFELREREFGRSILDFQYNLVPPVQSISPGISIGVLDAANESPDRRRFYLVTTFRELLEVGDSGANGELTLGYGWGQNDGVLVGFSLPLSQRTSFIADHNAQVLSVGINTNLFPGFNARFFIQEQQALFGFRYQVRF